MCDFSSDAESFNTPIIHDLQTFRKQWLDISQDSNSIALESWMDESEPGDSDLILQMDIEGAEYRNLMATPLTHLKRFRIIVIELHDLNVVNKSSQDDCVRPLLRRLGELFICVHAHPNNCCGEFADNNSGIQIPNVLELTFLRRDRFNPHNANECLPPSLPNALDISSNMPHKRPLFLSSQWTETRTMASIDRMFQIQADFTESSAQTLRSELNDLQSRIRLLERQLGEIHWPVRIFRTIKRFVRALASPFIRRTR